MPRCQHTEGEDRCGSCAVMENDGIARYCVKHGGGRRCKVMVTTDGNDHTQRECGNLMRFPEMGKCVEHGGRRTCGAEGCDKAVTYTGNVAFCADHMANRCKGVVKGTGKQCIATSMKDSEYCAKHHPDPKKCEACKGRSATWPRADPKICTVCKAKGDHGVDMKPAKKPREHPAGRCHWLGCSNPVGKLYNSQEVTDFCEWHGAGKKCQSGTCNHNVRFGISSNSTAYEYCNSCGIQRQYKGTQKQTTLENIEQCTKKNEGADNFQVASSSTASSKRCIRGQHCLAISQTRSKQSAPVVASGNGKPKQYCVRCIPYFVESRKCQEGGCWTATANTNFEYCKTHGGGIRCSVEGCTASARGRGQTAPLCTKHGGGRRCPHTDESGQVCGRSVEYDGSKFCTIHGGRIRCAVDGCKNVGYKDSSRDDGNYYCRSHSLSSTCQEEGCTKQYCPSNARDTSLKLCFAHGGGYRCQHADHMTTHPHKRPRARHKSLQGNGYLCWQHLMIENGAEPKCKYIRREIVFLGHLLTDMHTLLGLDHETFTRDHYCGHDFPLGWCQTNARPDMLFRFDNTTPKTVVLVEFDEQNHVDRSCKSELQHATVIYEHINKNWYNNSNICDWRLVIIRINADPPSGSLFRLTFTGPLTADMEGRTMGPTKEPVFVPVESLYHAKVSEVANMIADLAKGAAMPVDTATHGNCAVVRL